jgi:hypothetical protein
MITVLMRLAADLVFDSAADMRSSFRTEIDRYFKDRGFRSTPPRPTRTR